MEEIPFAFARRNGLLPLEAGEEQVRVAYRGGVKPSAIAELRRRLQRPLTLERVDNERFESLLREVYERSSGEAAQAMEGIGEDMDLQRVASELAEPQDLMETEDDAPVIRLINALLTEAIKEEASDIHIETFESRLVVRFRVDGVLREVLEPPPGLAPLLISRVKVMARLDIAEKRLPQDGRISLRIAGRPVDVRVSTLPVGQGERVVLRLLDKQAGRLDLTHLGMDSDTLARLQRIIHRPHGILLVTGPTGSGKTTTLYAALAAINDRQRNIMTVEDPIEYYIDGVNQTQINTKIDMTFARGLRAILRQDPDVVMVGEIRDAETMEIGIQASLTGHLVLSTLHTNTAIGAVTRLRDMGIEPFLLASSLIGVMAQRLVRLLCPHCRKPYTASEADLAKLGVKRSGTGEQSTITLYDAVGCEACNHLGFRGRTGIYDVIEIDANLRQMIHDGTGEHELERYARESAPSMSQDGARRVLQGDTTLAEVLRVTQAE
ncbi:type II secretion system ATPase GspE [Halorhodospira halochloris]|uniref:Type II secretion system protein E n=1 Tax=Halorhodospira halochloris TaxID=1052 RepID=A0A0X8X6P5_HALHR|nr:type II secretion system ATPase GspE [Halorhodospira halochloris]MBK1650910.1 type II secretion system protein GspE [Halorhodospira halochloris]MCG5529277.1 type II secretion system ATPase GspE [Halorhodospira halochloris]BAU56586.1 general secretion pathway protein E [Halorhodospira halochloris]